MDVTMLGLNIIIARVPKWPPHNWTLKRRRELARHIDEVRPSVRAYGLSNDKIPRIKALREHFGYITNEEGDRAFRLGLGEAKSLNELLWLDDGRGEIA